MIHRLLYDPIESLVYMIIRHQWGCVLGKINNSNRADGSYDDLLCIN